MTHASVVGIVRKRGLKFEEKHPHLLHRSVAMVQQVICKAPNRLFTIFVANGSNILVTRPKNALVQNNLH